MRLGRIGNRGAVLDELGRLLDRRRVDRSIVADMERRVHQWSIAATGDDKQSERMRTQDDSRRL